MSAPHILQVITRSDWGGAPRVVESLATNIGEGTAVACGPGGRLIDRLEDAGVPVHVQPHLRSAPHPRDALAYRDLRALVADGEFDVVHAHSTKAGALARIAAFREGVPTVFTVHGWGFYNTEYDALRPVLVRGERLLARRTDGIVCVSENDRRQGQDAGILSDGDGTVIHNGIPPLDHGPDRTRLREVFGIDPSTPIIGAVARLAVQKNPVGILSTAKELADRGHKVATVLIGSGPLAERCHQFKETHDLERVYMPGFRDDALELLPDFDVFLLPSRFEGFPLTVLECLHAGVPVVAHDVGGVGEAIDHGETGYVVPAGTTNERFTDYVGTLLEHPDRRAAMGRRAKQVASERYTEQRMVDEYRAVYESLRERA